MSVSINDDKEKRKQYLAMWDENFQNIIVEQLDKTELMESLTFDDCLEIPIPTEASFICIPCGFTWNSAKAMVIFVVSMNNGKLNIRREELGQRCERCIAHYELPTVKNIKDILEEVLMNILEEIYEIMDHGIEIYYDRPRKGRTHPHRRIHCQACSRRICGKKLKRRRAKKWNDLS